MPVIIPTTAPYCVHCYRESVTRAARAMEDPERTIMVRAALARIARMGTTASAADHARHPKRGRPWPSDATAAA